MGAPPLPAARTGPTVREALPRAEAALERAGCETARLDAELLLAHALGVDRAALFADSRRTLTRDAARRFDALVARRCEREPVAYLLGRKGFRFLELAVDARVLVPRPETELLVEVGLGLPRGARVVDVGTGSGAVALALKHERPDLEVTGADVDPGALAVASDNARRLGLDVALVRSDLLARLPGSWDAVLANLPYVGEADRAGLPPEVRDHEPWAALGAGEDGLAVLRRLVDEAVRRGVDLLALEIGAGQAPAVRDLLGTAGFEVELRRDLAGHERVAVARR